MSTRFADRDLYAGETLVAYLVTADGRTVGGPVRASAGIRNMAIDVGIDSPLTVWGDPLDELAEVWVYGAGMGRLMNLPIKSMLSKGGSVTITAEAPR